MPRATAKSPDPRRENLLPMKFDKFLLISENDKTRISKFMENNKLKLFHLGKL